MLLIILDKLGCLGGDFLKNVVNEGVHDGHGSLGDTGLWVHLLQHSVDVHGEGFDSLLLSDDHVFLDGRFLSWGSWHFYF